MKELYLVLFDRTTNKTFKKFFVTEFQMDKFKRKLKYSRKLQVIKDSREDYFVDYML
jgi:hypothetical protein